MRIPGIHAIPVKTLTILIIAAAAAFLVSANSDTAHADDPYDPTITQKACNALPAPAMPDTDVQGNPNCVDDRTPGAPMTTTTHFCISPKAAAITSSSIATATVITFAAPHGMLTLDEVWIEGHTGSTPDINGRRIVTKLTDTTLSIPVNVTADGTGGTMTFAGLPTRPTDCTRGDYNFVPPYVLTHVPPEAAVTPGCNLDTDADTVLDGRDFNGDTVIDASDQWDSDDDGLGDSLACLPPGEKVGGLGSYATLGLFNSTCAGGVPVAFSLFNTAIPNNTNDPRSSTNIYTPWAEGTTNSDVSGARFSKGTDDLLLPFLMAEENSDAFLAYPDWLLDLFDPDYIALSVASGGPMGGPAVSIIDGEVDVNGDTAIDVDDAAWFAGVKVIAGSLDIASPFGVINSADDGSVDVPFLGSTAVVDGLVDIDGDGNTVVPDTDDYTDNRQNTNDGTALPVLPRAAYGGLTIPGGSTDYVPLWFVVFAPGDLAAAYSPPHPFSQLHEDLGYTTFSILTDVTTTLATPNPISDFCSPLLAMTMLLGTTVGNHPDCPGGCVRATNPPDPGTYKSRTWTVSYRDLDQDGIENNLDTCPTIANLDGDPRDGTDTDADTTPDVFEPDNDALDSACDPGIGIWENFGDYDLDSFPNALDNCPLVPNGRPQDHPNYPAQQWDGQADSELVQAYSTAAPDGGAHKADSIGDACDTGTSNFTQNGVVMDVTLSPTVANGRLISKGIVTAGCFGSPPVDADNDGWCDPEDYNDSDPDIGGKIDDPPPDSDGDGFDVWIETYLGTDDMKACSESLTHAAWPLDIDNNQLVDIFDVNLMAPPVFFSSNGSPNYHARRDIQMDNIIDIFDVNLLAPPQFFSTCTPVAQQ